MAASVLRLVGIRAALGRHHGAVTLALRRPYGAVNEALGRPRSRVRALLGGRKGGLMVALRSL